MSGLDQVVEKIRSNEKTLYILCGYPYAGKSYVAEQILEKAPATVLVSIDSIFYAHGFDWDTNKLPNSDEWKVIFDESYVLAKEALANRSNVLYDSTNQTIASRDVLREVAQSVGANACVVFIQSDKETVWKRWEENVERKSRSVVSRELVAETINSFEIPTKGENVLVIQN